MWMQQVAKLKLTIATQLASKRGMQQTNLKHNSYTQLYNQQMMPRLPGCLFKFIQKQPPQPVVFILQVGSQLTSLSLTGARKLERCSQKFLTKFTRKTPVRVSFSNFIKRDFGRDFFKRDFGTCFSVNFAKFLRTPYSQLLACSLGDCCFL